MSQEYLPKKTNKADSDVQVPSAQFKDNRAANPLVKQLQGAAEELLNGDNKSTDNAVQRAQNNTGLPENLKSGMEQLSGMSLDHVNVHYNSPKPSTVQAHAFAQGNDIHVAPGQEKHVPHELGHVVQQAQGRVQPTTTVGGMQVNDSPALEQEATKMGEQAMQRATNETSVEPVPLLTPSTTQRQAIQLEPEPAKVIWGRTHVVRKVGNSLFGQGDFDENEVGPFGELVGGELIIVDPDKTFRSRRGGNQEQRHKREIQERTDPTVIWYHVHEIKRKNVSSDKLYVRSETVRVESVVDSERMNTLNPMGDTVPNHHELLTFAEESEADLQWHSKGPVGYAGKMMGKSGERDDFTRLMGGINEVVLTTGTIEDVDQLGGWSKAKLPEAEESAERRPGLSIINYSNAVYKKGSKIAVCGVRGKILMDQFGLAIREYVHAKTGKNIKVSTVFNADAVQPNYARLRGFFGANAEFRGAHTIVFGYASAFTEKEMRAEYKLKSKKQQPEFGWVGFLFENKTGGKFAVFDSDLSHSYHGEILAENVRLLLESDYGNHVGRVLIGGSAGSLVEPKTAQSGPQEETLAHNAIYIPGAVLRPDGFFKDNALTSVAMQNTDVLSSLPGSMHTSVISVLAETPSVLDDLYQYGIKTVDMEFAYVALVLGKATEPEQGRDLADVELGVACLVTDYPKTGAENVALKDKNKEAKRRAKSLFVQTVLASMR